MLPRAHKVAAAAVLLRSACLAPAPRFCSFSERHLVRTAPAQHAVLARQWSPAGPQARRAASYVCWPLFSSAAMKGGGGKQASIASFFTKKPGSTAAAKPAGPAAQQQQQQQRGVAAVRRKRCLLGPDR